VPRPTRQGGREVDPRVEVSRLDRKRRSIRLDSILSPALRPQSHAECKPSVRVAWEQRDLRTLLGLGLDGALKPEQSVAAVGVAERAVGIEPEAIREEPGRALELGRRRGG